MTREFDIITVPITQTIDVKVPFRDQLIYYLRKHGWEWLVIDFRCVSKHSLIRTDAAPTHQNKIVVPSERQRENRPANFLRIYQYLLERCARDAGQYNNFLGFLTMLRNIPHDEAITRNREHYIEQLRKTIAQYDERIEQSQSELAVRKAAGKDTWFAATSLHHSKEERTRCDEYLQELERSIPC